VSALPKNVKAMQWRMDADGLDVITSYGGSAHRGAVGPVS
jgi:hypothetical protein